ncbi:hypothetical protein LX73_2476 [Fodinibius salinus]|uniref:Probable membrane transporter protein n=1 Tax=Fodinibius salinus TaxID=860790 RepID=A0A5D3YKH3_9BACT|nr:sulfite exporter TauE/SafE family protein [Fodinibius salinus]TYP92222.1 hypothetical protein LX73_2476 [Fodinibius salinus]
MIEIVTLFLLGIIAGIIAGLFGLGGGILFTPILFVVFSDGEISDPVVLTIGSSLFCTFVASLGSSVRQFQQQNFFWSEGIKVGVMGAVGVFAGKQVITSPYYSEQVFVIFFSLLLMYVAFMFYSRGSKKQKHMQQNNNPLSMGQSLVSGGLGGFVAALGGIGGGGVMVPLLNLWYYKPFARTVSISSLAIVVISFSGWIQLGLTGRDIDTLTAFHWGYVDFGAALPLALGGLLGGFAGALFNLKINRRYLQFAFAVLAIGMAVKLLTDVF